MLLGSRRSFPKGREDLDELLSGTEQTTNNINTLLDLRQAEYSRIQANGSAALSNTILVFTIVTIGIPPPLVSIVAFRPRRIYFPAPRRRAQV